MDSYINTVYDTLPVVGTRSQTERIIDEVNSYRNGHKRYGFNTDHDDALVNGELLDAAMSYIKFSQQQIKTREYSKLKPPEHGRGPFIPPGGSNIGYHISPSTVVPMPKTWPSNMGGWAPDYPRHNLLRAASLIVAELERLERLDRKSLTNDKPKSKKPRNADVIFSVADGETLPFDKVHYSANNTVTFNPSTWSQQAVQTFYSDVGQGSATTASTKTASSLI